MVLLFNDILVLIEKIPKKRKEPEKFVLKPLVYKLNDKNYICSPIIPISFIHSPKKSDGSKRGFSLVVIIPNDNNAKNIKYKSELELILTALTDDNRNQMIDHLQRLKENDKIEIDRKV